MESFRSARGGSDADTGLVSRFRREKRRFIQGVLEKIGKSEHASDEVFQDGVHRFQEFTGFVNKAHQLGQKIRSLTQELSGAINEFATNIHEYCDANDELKNSSLNEMSLKTAKSFKDTLDGPIRIADQVMGQHFIQPLEQVMHRCGMLSELIERRERNKMDYNSYVRKIKELKESPNASALKIQSKERKFAETTKILSELNVQIYSLFDNVHCSTELLFMQQLSTLITCHSQIFASLYSATSIAKSQMPPTSVKQVAVWLASPYPASGSPPVEFLNEIFKVAISRPTHSTHDSNLSDNIYPERCIAPVHILDPNPNLSLFSNIHQNSGPYITSKSESNSVVPSLGSFYSSHSYTSQNDKNLAVSGRTLSAYSTSSETSSDHNTRICSEYKTPLSNNPNTQNTIPQSISTHNAPYSQCDSSTSHQPPYHTQSLPPGWQEAYDEAGSVYYWNTNTGRVQWERPYL